MTGSATPTGQAPPHQTLAALFVRFLGFGVQAFGGPVAQIGALHHELVQRQRWTEDDRFRKVLAVYQALPGPEATELCIWFGTLARGRLGGLVAGLGFMLPGFVLMLLASSLLLRQGPMPGWLGAAFFGMQAGAVALVLRAATRLARGLLRERALTLVAAGAALGAVLQIPFGASLLAGAIAVPCLRQRTRPTTILLVCAITGWFAAALWTTLHVAAPLAIVESDAAAAPTAAPGVVLFGSGLRAGLLTFGGAYTVIPFLQADAVGPGGWMTQTEFLDGLAVGGVLPSPLVIVGAWIGYAGGGLPGALLLTLGIFLPAFVLPLLLHHRLEQVVACPAAHAALDGIGAAVVGLVAAVAFRLASGLLPLQLLLATLALVVLVFVRGRLVPLCLMLSLAVVGQLHGLIAK